MVESILAYLWQALSATLIQILILLGLGLFLTLILHFEVRFIETRAVSTLGRGWYLGLFGWLGTIVHELGHAIFCMIFGHKITEIKLFSPDPETGTTGYVKHSYNRTNIYQLVGNFFIGIGPILLGTVVIFLLAYGLLGLNPFNASGNFNFASSQLNSWDSFRELLQSLWNSSGHLFREIFAWEHLSSWQLYAFIYLVFAVGSSITLSPSDIKAALVGFSVIAVLVFLLNLGTVWAGNYITDAVTGIGSYYAQFYTLVFLIILVNLAVALVLLWPLSLVRSHHSKAKRLTSDV
jgi:hypothetical protein